MEDQYPSDEEIEALEKANAAYLGEFDEWLTNSGLKERTICKHLSNADVFLSL